MDATHFKSQWGESAPSSDLWIDPATFDHFIAFSLNNLNPWKVPTVWTWLRCFHFTWHKSMDVLCWPPLRWIIHIPSPKKSWAAGPLHSARCCSEHLRSTPWEDYPSWFTLITKGTTIYLTHKKLVTTWNGWSVDLLDLIPNQIHWPSVVFMCINSQAEVRHKWSSTWYMARKFSSATRCLTTCLAVLGSPTG